MEGMREGGRREKEEKVAGEEWRWEKEEDVAGEEGEEELRKGR